MHHCERNFHVVTRFSGRRLYFFLKFLAERKEEQKWKFRMTPPKKIIYASKSVHENQTQQALNDKIRATEYSALAFNHPSDFATGDTCTSLSAQAFHCLLNSNSNHHELCSIRYQLVLFAISSAINSMFASMSAQFNSVCRCYHQSSLVRLSFLHPDFEKALCWKRCAVQSHANRFSCARDCLLCLLEDNHTLREMWKKYD